MNLKPPLIEFIKKSIYFNFNCDYTRSYVLKAKSYYHGYDWNFIHIGIDNKMFDCKSWYYDGHVYKGIVFFFLGIGLGWTYTWEKDKFSS